MVVGMGGSAIGGDLLRDLGMGRIPIPVISHRGFGVPAFVGPSSGIVSVSYSGETAETLSVFEEAKDRGAQLWAIASGGTLAKRAQESGVPVAILPGGLPPRAALGALYFSLVGLAESLGLLEPQTEAVEEALELCEQLNNRYRPEATEEENSAFVLAQRLMGATPSIFGVHGLTDGVARRWKSQFNENSKMAASFDVLPELVHNEVVSFEIAPGPTALTRIVILVEDSEDNPYIIRQREHLAEWLTGRGVSVERVSGEGQSRLARLTSLVLFGDWVSYYAAILRDVDPTPIVSIDTLKERRAEEPTG
jgi:glucose/mannose-6-phosphate isomerase